uniref:Uncharacterized protein n=1 Tax=Timema tahoe TaxID=61484 RepID=A0A7R9FH62_9NEOP|nr:unnamed protein product [Timema tahoe]
MIVVTLSKTSGYQKYWIAEDGLAKVRISAGGDRLGTFYVRDWCTGLHDGPPDPEQVSEAEKRISDQIRAVLAHYRHEDPVGLPGAPVSDPMPIPDMKQSFSLATMNFKSVNMLGLSKFRLQYVHADLTAMKVKVGIQIALLEIKGQYKLSSWFSGSSQGPFTVNLTQVQIDGVGNLEVQRSGQLQAENINLDILFKDISMKFENLGFTGTLFQGILNSVGTFLFDSIKPFILKQVNTDIRGDVNKELAKLPQQFPDSISPFDMAIAEVRWQVRKMGYDPYLLPDYHHTAAFLTVDLNHVWITGLSSFYRVGNMSINMTNNVGRVHLHVGTQKLEGKCIWEVAVKALVSQPLDIRKKPQLEELDLKLGNIQVRMDGSGSLDYVVELLVNVLPNLLRFQIMSAVEGPIKNRVQEVLDSLDLEKIVEEKLPELDNLL